MASSRFDNIKYSDGANFKVPSQIKVYNGSSWVDLGRKDSDNTRKLVVYDGSNFDCVTYKKRVVNVPGYASFGSNRYADIKKGDGSIQSVDNWLTGYHCEMVVEVNSSSSLYMARSTNQGDIEYSYTEYRADVSGNTVRFRCRSRFRGYMSDAGGAWGDSSSNEATGYVWTVGEKVRIVLHKTNRNGLLNVKVYNPSGVLLCDNNLKEKTLQVWTPKFHRLGAGLDANDNVVSEGDFKMYSFNITPISNRDNVMYLDFNSVNSGSTRVNATGYGGYVDLVNTSTYKANYDAWDRQTI